MQLDRVMRLSVSGLVSLALLFAQGNAALAIETSTAVSAASNGEFSLEPDTSEHGAERKEIEDLLSNIETQWNAHSLDSVMNYYADDYINNDGLDKKAVPSSQKISGRHIR